MNTKLALETVASICLSSSVTDTLYNEIGSRFETLVEQIMGEVSLTDEQQEIYEGLLGGGSKEEWHGWIDLVTNKT